MAIQSVDMEQIRAEFPLTKEWAYLNHAGTGPFPLRTSKAVAAAGESWTNPEHFDYQSRDMKLAEVRQWLGSLAGTTADRVVFTSSLAESMNLMAHSVEWKPGDNVLLETGEFPSVVYPYRNLERRNGIQIKWVERDEEGHARLSDFEAAMDDRTRAVAISHIEYMDGYRNDLQALGNLCRSRGVELFVDVTQSYGAQPIDLDTTGVTAIGAHGYKWLLCNFETGYLVLGEGALERMSPIFAGRESVTSEVEDASFTLNWKSSAERFQLSNLSTLRIEIMHASLSMLMEVGLEQSGKITANLTDYLVDELNGLGYEVLSDRSPERRSQIVVFTSTHAEENAEIVDSLRSHKVAVSLRGGNVRVSPYFYNTTRDIDRLLEILPPR